MSVNKVILVGHLGKDPKNNNGVVNVSIATSEKYTKKNGDEVNETEWHNLVFFAKLGEIAMKYLTKGSEIYVEGKIKTNKWTDKEGNERKTPQVICQTMQMLGGKNNNTVPVAAAKSAVLDEDFPF